MIRRTAVYAAVVLSVVLAGVLAPRAGADELTLTDGTVLKGDIVSCTKAGVKIHGVLGELVVPWDKIREEDAAALRKSRTSGAKKTARKSTVTLEYKDAGIALIAKDLQVQAGKSFILDPVGFDPEDAGRATVFLKDAPLAKTLNLLSSLTGASFVMEPHFCVVTSPDRVRRITGGLDAFRRRYRARAPRPVSLTLHGASPARVMEEVAKQAGLNIVMKDGEGRQDLPPLSIAVRDVPAVDLLGLVIVLYGAKCGYSGGTFTVSLGPGPEKEPPVRVTACSGTARGLDEILRKYPYILEIGGLSDKEPGSTSSGRAGTTTRDRYYTGSRDSDGDRQYVEVIRGHSGQSEIYQAMTEYLYKRTRDTGREAEAMKSELEKLLGSSRCEPYRLVMVNLSMAFSSLVRMSKGAAAAKSRGRVKNMESDLKNWRSNLRATLAAKKVADRKTGFSGDEKESSKNGPAPGKSR